MKKFFKKLFKRLRPEAECDQPFSRCLDCCRHNDCERYGVHRDILDHRHLIDRICNTSAEDILKEVDALGLNEQICNCIICEKAQLCRIDDRDENGNISIWTCLVCGVAMVRDEGIVLEEWYQ